MKIIFNAVLLILIFFTTTFSQIIETVTIEGAEAAKGRIIVKFKKPALKKGLSKVQISQKKQAILFKHQASIEKKWRMGAELWLCPGDKTEEVLKALQENPLIEYAEPDYIITADVIPNDPSFGEQWALHNTGQTGGTPDADIDAPEAWEITTGDTNILVGVLDSGIDYNHPDLAPNIWRNPNEIPGNGIDDDGNGYVDDVHGWDFVNDDNDPMDDNGHGTHVAGIIGAVGDNGIGVAGVAWEVNLLGLKILNKNNRGSTSDVISAIEYATMMSVKITNNSYGRESCFGSSQAEYDAISSANYAGMLFCAAAGNSGHTNDNSTSYQYAHFPASYDLPNIISVAASENDDELADYSNWGEVAVDLAAPGTNIYSTLANESYGYKTGTSMSTPLVSGSIVLAWSFFPSFSASEIKKRLMETVDIIPSHAERTVTGGRLNVFALLGGISKNPAYLNFGAELVRHQSEEKKFYITNTSNNVITIESIVVNDGFLISKDIGYSNLIGTFQIEPEQIDSISVVFVPDSIINYRRQINIFYSLHNSQSANTIVSVVGRSVGSGSIISGGLVSGVWTSTNSPYFINGDIQVENGEILSIEPGVLVEFQGHFSLTVGENASIRAIGTISDSILFRPRNTDEGWYGLRLIHSGHDDTLSYCQFIHSIKDRGIPLGNVPYEDYVGGAIYCLYSSPTITHCLFYKNRAHSAAGIYICDWGTGYPTTLLCNKIINNYAEHQDGGITLYIEHGLVFNNNLVCNNYATLNAGGMNVGFYGDQAPFLFNNNTIVYNRVHYFYGGGIYLESGFPQFLNNILWGNKSDNNPNTNQIFIQSGANFNPNYCDIEGGFKGEGNFSIDPKFASPSAGSGTNYDGLEADWQLQNDSHCINSGVIDTSGLKLGVFDVAVNQRIYGNVIDIGAHENQNDLALISSRPSSKLDFEGVVVGDSSTAQVTLFSGTVDVQINNVVFFDNTSENFTLEGISNLNTISANDSASFFIKYKPTSTGIDSGHVKIVSNALNFPEKVIDLRGTGIVGSVIDTSNISGVLRKEYSPFNIKCDIYVNSVDSLIIEPGVELVFNGHYSFTIEENSKLLAKGTDSDSIIFTASDTTLGWGGIRFLNSGNNDTLDYCIIEYAKKGHGVSQEDKYGAGIYLDGTDAIIQNCRISNNTALYDGGGIECWLSSPVIKDNLISYNQGSDGAGIHVVSEPGNNVKILNNLIIFNTAINKGGAVSIGANGNSYIYDNLIANNVAWQGGGICSRYNKTTIRNNIIVNNRGGGIRTSSCDLKVFNNIIVNNEASEGGGLILFGSFAKIVNNIIWGNSASSEDQIYVYDDCSVIVEYCDIQGGIIGFGNINLEPLFIGPSLGVGISFDGVNANWHLQANSPCIDAGNPDKNYNDLEDPHILNNARYPSLGTLVNDMGAYGGPCVIWSTGGTPISNFTADFTPSTAPLEVQFIDLSTNNPTNWLWDFGDGTTSNKQYPFHTYEKPGVFAISLTVKDDNDSTDTITRPDYITVYNRIASGIWSVDKSPYYIHGELEIPFDSTLTIEPGVEIIFTDNYKLNIFGRLLAIGTKTDTIVFTAENEFFGWNGLRFLNTDYNGQDSSKLVYCKLSKGIASGNHPDGWGGAIYCKYSSNILIDHCLIFKNISETGGGISCYMSNPKVCNTIVRENIANYGGGIACNQSSPLFENVIISNNFAECGYGGGIYVINSGEPTFKNVVISENIAGEDGGAIYCSGPSPKIYNSVLTHNKGQYGIYIQSGEPAILYSNIWNLDTENFYNCGDSIGVNIGTNANGDPCDVYYNIQEDPLFIDPDNGDFHLQECSPCINAGTPDTTGLNLPVFDLDGNPRIVDGIIDMGAYEYVPPEPITVTFQFSDKNWYLISIPVIPQDSSISVLFPNALGGAAYHWNPNTKSYDTKTKLEPKKAYWLAIPEATTNTVTGIPLNTYSQHFPAQGWYMIGGVIGNTDFTNPNDNPDGAVLSPAYSWDPGVGNYVLSDTLKEKKGYWAAVLEECNLTVASASAGQSNRSINIAKTNWEKFTKSSGSAPPPPPNVDWETGKIITVPDKFALHQNYPNPFNPQTTIKFDLPKESYVEIIIYNILGQKVRTLVNREIHAGNHTIVWNGKNDLDLQLSTGIYLCFIKAGDFIAINKLLLLK